MIDVSLQPGQMVAGVVTDVVVRLRNVGIEPCTNIRLEFEMPRALRLVEGSRRVQLTRLEPGMAHDHPVRIHAQVPGAITVALPYLSFRDGRGSNHYEDDRELRVQVMPGPHTPTSSTRMTGASPLQSTRRRVRPSVFISHRRSDSGYFVDHLADRLREHLPDMHVFVDYDDMRPAEDFRQRLEEELARCSALVALIGPGWATSRLHSDDDLVRRELAVGLVREVVVPVLFDNARMPVRDDLPHDIRGLADRQAAEVTRRHFDADVYELALIVEEIVEDRAP